MMNDLAALLGGGAAPAAPLPSSPDPSLDPLAAALMGGGGPAPMGGPADPMAAMMGGMAPAPMGGGFASTDPQFVDSVLSQLLMAKEQDHAALEAQQAAAMAGSPLLEALLSGAPVGPGAGQDAQAIGMATDIAPAPADMGLLG